MKNDILSGLRKLNFEELIHIDTDDAADYSFETYTANGGHKIKAGGAGGCVRCETSGLASQTEMDSKPKLSLISHGAHSQDYLSLLKGKSPKSSIDWRDNPVLFVLESPSTDSGQYHEEDTREIWKKPARSWYWLPDESKLENYDPLNYAKNSTQGKYGEYFASIIYRFGLRNAYVTNMMKCGISTLGKPIFDSGQYKCVRDNCIDQYLSREIKIFQPEAIFTFGTNAYDGVRRNFKEYDPSRNLICLPHPASRHKKNKFQEMSHERLLIGLKLNGIINDAEAHILATDFMEGR